MAMGVDVPGTRIRVAVLAAALLMGVCAASGPAVAAHLSARGSKVRSQLLLSVFDAAPLAAHVPTPAPFLGFLPDGRLTFVGMATPGWAELLGIVEDGKVRVLLHAGQTVGACAVRSIGHQSVGLDGTLAVFVQCTHGSEILTIDADSGALAVAQADRPMDQQFLYSGDVAVDGQGHIITRMLIGLDETIARVSPGRDPEILVKSGDALGGGTLVHLIQGPSVDPSGNMAFTALTSVGTEVVAVLPPGGSPRVVLSAIAPDPSDSNSLPFVPAPPSINAAGVVGVLGGDRDHISLHRVDPDGNETRVHAGDPAPGGRTFTSIDIVNPAVDADGGVIFGGRISGGGGGLYRFDGSVTTVVAEDRVADPSSGLVGVGGWSMTPLPCADGAVRFVATDENGTGVFAWRQGSITKDLHEGDPLDGPARFETFRGGNTHLSSGPFIASDGAILFDARTTGRGRGLFVRQPDGTILPVAIDGDAGPEGGRYVGESFAFHSIAAGGLLAFIGEAAPEDTASYTRKRELYAGRIGQLQRLLGEGDVLPWSAAEISLLGPPSGISADGVIVLPVTMTDGWMFLLAWDGTRWTKLAGTGDLLPDGQIISLLQVGYRPLAPQLTNDGRIVFGVVTVDGGSALYGMALAEGLPGAKRIVGLGDAVPGGTLTPFQPQAYAADGNGLLALQAVPSGETYPATYAQTPGHATVRLAGLGLAIPRQFPPLPPGSQYPPDMAWPRLALMAGGVLHEESGPLVQSLLFTPPRASQSTGLAPEPIVLVGQFNSSPDGGFFAAPSGFLGAPGYGIQDPTRLASDGVHRVVAIEPTSLNYEIMVLFDLKSR